MFIDPTLTICIWQLISFTLKISVVNYSNNFQHIKIIYVTVMFTYKNSSVISWCCPWKTFPHVTLASFALLNGLSTPKMICDFLVIVSVRNDFFHINIPTRNTFLSLFHGYFTIWKRESNSMYQKIGTQLRILKWKYKVLKNQHNSKYFLVISYNIYVVPFMASFVPYINYWKLWNNLDILFYPRNKHF